MAVVTKSIGTTGRDYSTIAAWEAAIDNTTYPDAGTNVVGECYNDSVFDEAVSINASATNVASVKLSVASGQRHNGTGGTGARVVCSVDRAWALSTPASRDGLYGIEWLDFHGNGKVLSFVTGSSAGYNSGYFKKCLIHNSIATAVINASDRDLLFVNNFVYSCTRTGGITGLYIDADLASGGVLNNTFYKIYTTTGSVTVKGIYVFSDDPDGKIRNNISVACTVGAGGTASDFVFGGSTNLTSSNNLSSDATADDGGGSNHITNATVADLFVSTTAGSEDLHLKAGSPAINAGACAPGAR